MKKSYFLNYGCEASKEEVLSLFQKTFEIEFSEHESFYFGIYYSCSTWYADTFKVFDNYIEHAEEWLEEDHKIYPTLIQIAFTSGKNVDKLSKYEFLKGFFNKNSDFVMIKDTFIEEN